MASTDAELGRYRSKRDFAKTGEPSGASVLFASASSSTGQSFVVQRHRARRLHYDFRLQIGGVLVSWAIPRGPSMDPSVKRLAVHVEDHPLEYASFEGVIPKGEYGAGDVIVWDRGSFRVQGDGSAREQLQAGALHLLLVGHKLTGAFMLIRTGRGGQGRSGPGEPHNAASPDDGRDWLFFHKSEGGIAGWDPEDHPLSVLSARTNDQVRSSVDELAELESTGSNGLWHFAGRDLRLTNLDRVMFPARPVVGQSEPPNSSPAVTDRGVADRGVTKRDLVRHYAALASYLLPMTFGRPVNLHRFPKGVEDKGFWQKAVPQHTPDWIERWDNPGARRGETVTYFVASEPAALAWLANYGVIELHAWTSTAARPDEPSFAIFDLDPGPNTSWNDLLDLARLHREALRHLGLVGFPNVSGQRGIQIRVPVEAGLTFDQTREWVEAVSRAVAQVRPELVSWEWNVAERGGRARLDFTQNARNKTIVAPYCPRPSPGAPVATPIRWEELDDVTLRPDRWDIRNIGERLSEVGDLMADLDSTARPLPML